MFSCADLGCNKASTLNIDYRTDGAEFGMGAEIAVSTQKVHARGPVGLKELTSYKWIVRGNYQVRK